MLKHSLVSWPLSLWAVQIPNSTAWRDQCHLLCFAQGLGWPKLQLKTPSDCDWETEASGVGGLDANKLTFISLAVS